MILSGCKNIPVTPDIVIPTFTAQRPARPVLEKVTLSTPVPPPLLRNYSAVTLYSMSMEDYADGLEEFQELINK